MEVMSSSTKSMFVDLNGKEVPLQTIIGIGGTGVVVRKEQYAIKIPRVSRERGQDGLPLPAQTSSQDEERYDESEPHTASINDEKSIYRRLGEHEGIVNCFNAWTDEISIRMPYMEMGDLRHYLAKHDPENQSKISWLRQIARAMAYVHQKRIILADIRSDNLMLAENFKVKFIDFGESSLMPLEWNLKGADPLGFSIQTDIGQFGAVMFEIVTGKHCEFSLTHEWNEPGDPLTRPPREILPSTENVWLGSIIEKCWTEKFSSVEDLILELDEVVVD